MHIIYKFVSVGLISVVYQLDRLVAKSVGFGYLSVGQFVLVNERDQVELLLVGEPTPNGGAFHLELVLLGGLDYWWHRRFKINNY